MSTDLKPTNPKDRAATSRLDLSLFPQTAIAYGALGMVEGDCKYGGYNYRVRGVRLSVYIAACFRHLFKCYNGEWANTKTKVPHLGSALACLGIIIDAHVMGCLVDDRPPRLQITGLLDEFEGVVRHLQGLYANGPARYTQREVDLGSYANEDNKGKAPPSRKTMSRLRKKRPAAKRRANGRGRHIRKSSSGV